MKPGHSMSKFDAQDRKALPHSDFAVPSKAPGSGSYPIPDKAHAQNALARVAQHGDPAEKRAVEAKVHAKFPGVGQHKPAGPERDTREQSRQFQPPPGQRGGPPNPTAAQTLPKSAPNRSASSNTPSRSTPPGPRDGVSGIDRAMAAHADRLHPGRR